MVDRRQALDHTTPITHGQFNPDAPFLASLVADEEAVHINPDAAGELDDKTTTCSECQTVV